MTDLLPNLLPLVAALIYVFSALLVKRSADLGVGVWRTAFVSNLTTAVLFQLLLPLGGTFQAANLWQPAIVALVFIGGQVLGFLALSRGDVSVVTPLLGLKVILVAFFTTVLLKQGLPARLWAAATLSSCAIALLNRTGKVKHHHVGRTIVYTAGSAAMFALFDVLVQKWSPQWGAGRFLPVMFACAAVLSLVLIPLFHAPLREIPRQAWRWLLAGCVFMGVQSLIFVTAIAKFRNATTANILYSSRGLWSVLAVWVIGHWFMNREQQLGASMLRLRLVGAALMIAAIFLALA